MTQNFKDFLRELENENVDYILIGGFAVVIRGFNRFTEDIDIIVKNSSNNIKKLQKALKNIYDDDSIDEITLNEIKDYSVIRYGAPDGFSVDIIGNLQTAFNFDNIEFEKLIIEDITIFVATPESLYKMKKDTMRPSDQMDCMFLKNIIKNRI